MATLIPTLGAARFDARGELRLAERLKDCLEDNAWVWHDIPVGPFGRHPDFVTLHPRQGIVVLEVKDWRLETIVEANSKQVELMTVRGNVYTENPFEQVRSYMFNVVDTLRRDPLLVNEGGSFKGKPVFSFGHGVAFSNITRKQFEETDLHEVFPPERCIFRDEMAEKVDPDAFRERVWRMVSPRIGPALSLPQIDRMRARLFPEIRVTQIALPFDEAHDFEPQWLALAAKMVNPDTKALMIVYDDAQAIYKGRKRPVWKQLGIEAAGRTTVLKVNYRNTAQTLRFARKFAADVIGAPGLCAGDESAILMPEDGGREGVEPVVRQCVSHDGEAHAIAEWLLGRKAAGYQWGQMAVLYPRHYIGERFEKTLAKHGVPVDVAKSHNNRVQTKRDAVRFLSMHNAKGLEFPCVAIGGLGELKKAEDIEDDVRLTYVAITRATHEAFITYSNMSELVGRLVV